MRHCRGPDALALDTWNRPIAARSRNVGAIPPTANMVEDMVGLVQVGRLRRLVDLSTTMSRAEVTTDRLGICGLTIPPTSPIGDCHLVAGDLQDELLAGFGAHAARVGRCTRDVKLPGKPQQAHFFAWYTPVRAASPPQVAHPVNSGFFVSMPTRRPFSVPT